MLGKVHNKKKANEKKANVKKANVKKANVKTNINIKLTIIYITYIDQHSYFGKWHQRNYKNNFILYKYINGSFSK